MPSYRLIVAKALADAFLAGPWTVPDLVARGQEVVGRRRWLAPVARAAVAAFPEAPLTRRWLFARKIRSFRAFEPVRPRRLSLAPFEMVPRFGAPALSTTGDLAAWLEVDVDRLDWLADVRNLSRLPRDERLLHYRCSWVAKRSGGWRLIQAPKADLRAVQRRILDGILAPVPLHDAAHGFCRGRSPITAMEPHVGRAVVVRVDLSEFFPSVARSRVRAIFRALGYPDRVTSVLAALCTHAVPPAVLRSAPGEASPRLRTPHLPQGGPASPMLANLCAFGLDVRVSALAERFGATYTRYADDLIFSGEAGFERSVDAFLPWLGVIALDEGFDVNWRKTRVMRRSGRQHALGLVVNEARSVARSERDELEAILFNCVRTSPEAQNRRGIPAFEAHLRGRIAWVEAADARHGAELRALFEQIRW